MEHFLRHSPKNPRNSEGALVQLADGGLFFAYTRYNSDDNNWHDEASADIFATVSHDKGQTWCEPYLIVKNENQNVMSVSLLRLQDGRIAMVYSKKSVINDYNLIDCRPFICFSSDEAKTWSEPIDIASVPAIYLVNLNDNLIQLECGRLILSVSYHRYSFPKHLMQGIGLFFLSDDGGLTWRQSKECCYPSHTLRRGLMEPGIIELKDGRLMCWFRTTDHCQYKSFSYDQGETWSAPIPAKEFLSPESPMALKRDPISGDLVAVWNDYSPLRSVRFENGVMGRTPLVLARSSDEGVTWDRHIVLEDSPRHGFAYTAMLFADERLYLAYCCGGLDTCECMLQDIKIRDVQMQTP